MARITAGYWWAPTRDRSFDLTGLVHSNQVVLRMMPGHGKGADVEIQCRLCGARRRYGAADFNSAKSRGRPVVCESCKQQNESPLARNLVIDPERCNNEFGLSVTELRTVVVVMAHERTLGKPISGLELRRVAHRNVKLQDLVHRRWLDLAKTSPPKTYRATKRAWKELGQEQPK